MKYFSTAKDYKNYSKEDLKADLDKQRKGLIWCWVAIVILFGYLVYQQLYAMLLSTLIFTVPVGLVTIYNVVMTRTLIKRKEVQVYVGQWPNERILSSTIDNPKEPTKAIHL